MVVAELKEKEQMYARSLEWSQNLFVLFPLTLLAKTIHKTSVQIIGKETLLHEKSYKFRLLG